VAVTETAGAGHGATRTEEEEDMNKYKTSAYSDRIEVVEFVSETAKTCVIVFNWNKQRHERKVVKMSDTDQYHDTWAAAHAYLLARAETKVLAAAEAVNDAQVALKVIDAMKPPKGAKT
jgi:hypothetical protein